MLALQQREPDAIKKKYSKFNLVALASSFSIYIRIIPEPFFLSRRQSIPLVFRIAGVRATQKADQKKYGDPGTHVSRLREV